MWNLPRDLRAAVERASDRLTGLEPSERDAAPRPGAWTRRELLGHLVDSASNNHQRFVRAQFVDHLDFPGYDQDAWVTSQSYAQSDWDVLAPLWRTFNLHIADVLERAPEDALTRPRLRHSLDRIAFEPQPADAPVTLAWFAEDYLAHMNHHLRVLLAAS